MNQVIDSIAIALQAIWANKLRSFMTVLGNIVAVTSIVTVVTLIQGMNGMVADAIVSDVGADSFTIQRRPPILNEDDEERTRNNPLITVDEADAIRAFSPIIAAV
ncbi:MAG TPA: ABC transporter permease, partial [Vicinamibacterales bacterium]|nr:ABC transporter permease [Vicinamibacterales bacterium]